MGEVIEWKTFERNGLKYQVRAMVDHDTTPDDADCYSEDDKRAWRDGSWCYVGIVVTVEGIDASQAGVWGVEWGVFADKILDLGHYYTESYAVMIDADGNRHESTMIEDLMNEARANARAERNRLNALPL